MERFYSFAGITFRICGPEGQMFRNENALECFAVAAGEADCTCRFGIVEHLSEPDGECIFRSPTLWVFESQDAQIRYQGPLKECLSGAYLRISRRGGCSDIQVLSRAIPDYISAKLVLNAMETEHRIVQNHGFLLHASFICHEGKAILFTAPSGTGKSTQAELWCRLRNAEQINGDRAAVTVSENGIRVWGVPFSGSSGICRNACVPLGAIVYLTQAPQTRITRLKGLQAFRHIWEGCSINVWDQQDVDLCSQTIMEAVSAAPIFHLACTPDEAAVIVLEKALEQVR